MFLHIGGEVSIPAKTILGIFDFDEFINTGEGNINYIKSYEDRNLAENVSYDIPRSLIVALDKIYISPISTRTLKQRLEKSNSFLQE